MRKKWVEGGAVRRSAPKARLGLDRFEQLAARGALLSDDEAVAYARRAADEEGAT